MKNGTSSPTSLSAFGSDDLAVVRVDGPGICKESGRFESLLLQVEERGFRTLVIDLGDCPRMDSTFAGALLRMADRAATRRNGEAPRRVVLAGARDQVAELIDTLCLGDVLETVELPKSVPLARLGIEGRELSKEEVTAISLDGHQLLSELNAANASRFASLLPLLRSELERLRAERRASEVEAKAPTGEG